MRDSEASLGRRLLAWWFLLTERSSFVRFLLFGVWNTAWTFALYAFLVAKCQMNHLLAIFIVWAIAFVVGYVVNFLWVFRTAQRLRLRHHLRRYVIPALGHIRAESEAPLAAGRGRTSATVARAIHRVPVGRADELPGRAVLGLPGESLTLRFCLTRRSRFGRHWP